MELHTYLLQRFLSLNALKSDDLDRAFAITNVPTTTTPKQTILGFESGGVRYEGSGVVTHPVLDLPTLFKNLTPTVSMFKPKNTREVLKELLLKYGLPVGDTEELLEDYALTALPTATQPTSVNLVAQPSNRLYSGNLTVTIKQKVMPLDEIVTVTDLDVVAPRLSLTNSLVVLERRFYHYNFTDTAYLANIKAQQVGKLPELNDSWFQQLLNSADVKQECGNLSWVWGGYWTPNGFNLYLAQCVYNGPTTGWPDANQHYKSCMVVSIPAPSSTVQSVTGYAILHYE